MANFHITAILHAFGVNAKETTADFLTEVLVPAWLAELMVAAEGEYIGFIELLIADQAVLIVLRGQRRVNVRIRRPQARIKL